MQCNLDRLEPPRETEIARFEKPGNGDMGNKIVPGSTDWRQIQGENTFRLSIGRSSRNRAAREIGIPLKV